MLPATALAVLVGFLAPLAPSCRLGLLRGEDAEQPANDGDRCQQAEDAPARAVRSQGTGKMIKPGWFQG